MFFFGPQELGLLRNSLGRSGAQLSKSRCRSGLRYTGLQETTPPGSTRFFSLPQKQKSNSQPNPPPKKNIKNNSNNNNENNIRLSPRSPPFLFFLSGPLPYLDLTRVRDLRARRLREARLQLIQRLASRAVTQQKFPASDLVWEPGAVASEASARDGIRDQTREGGEGRGGQWLGLVVSCGWVALRSEA